MTVLSCALALGCTEAPPQVPDAPVRTSPEPPAPVEAEPFEFESPGGMWVPRQIPEHADTLKKLGLEIDPKKLSDPMAHPLGAVISLGGCSASFVSADGLIVTNHHCVTGALQFNSTKEHNLLENGYVARTRADEKSIGPTGRVYVTQKFEDVTKQVNDGLEALPSDKARHDKVEERTKSLIAKCESARANVRCNLATYFGGAERLLITRLEIKDVRLVYAPHRGIGEFGGETDNWMWPRHTGDFSFYRAYVDPNGNPAPFAKTNVPYKPPHHLKLPTKPLSAGDLVFVAGYPGRTQRLHTAAETTEAVEWEYPLRIKFYRDAIVLLEDIGKTDPEAKIATAPRVFGLKNALKYFRGALEGLSAGGAATERSELENKLRQFVSSDPARQTKYGDVFQKLDAMSEARKKTRESDRSLTELTRLSLLLDAAVTIVRMANERAKENDSDRDPRFQKRNWQRLEQGQRRMQKSYNRAADQASLAFVAERASKLPKSLRPAALKAITGSADPSDKIIERAVSGLYQGTKLEDADLRVKLLTTAKPSELARSADSIIRLALKLVPMIEEREVRDDAVAGAMMLLRPKYTAALGEMKGSSLAPDANGTLRVSYGTVRGYRPQPDKPVYEPFTVLSEVIGKSTGKKPFNTPKKLLDAHSSAKFGPYVHEDLDEVPVNFLADLDITGGNSGSPTLNARGEVVGLAFDGNYEAMASDWLFMPSITRSIHVDIRYALWVLDAVDGAGHVLKELGVTPKFASGGAKTN